MITVRIAGGLGNQMFQYACGRALQLRRAKKGIIEGLALDLLDYRIPPPPDDPRPYGLDVFAIQATVASPEEARRLRQDTNVLARAKKIFQRKILRQFNIGWRPAIFHSTKLAYIEGYWQTEKYFLDAAETIRSEFQLKKPLQGRAREWHELIKGDSRSVSLHVRRGDYVSHKSAANMIGAQDISYYESALREISRSVKTACVYVFSDDIEWAQAHLHEEMAGPGATFRFVSSPELLPHEELVLMSACRAHIIANSTFSWWGAWLDPRPDKIVIAPRRWARKHDRLWYKDIIPASWIRL